MAGKTSIFENMAHKGLLKSTQRITKSSLGVKYTSEGFCDWNLCNKVVLLDVMPILAHGYSKLYSTAEKNVQNLRKDKVMFLLCV